MKKLFVLMAIILLNVTYSFAQSTWGTITFNNRGLSPATAGGTPYSVPINGVTDVASARAQLYLVTGSAGSETYTPLTPLQTFRASPNEEFFVGPVSVSVTGQAPGTAGLRFVVRAWQDAPTYETATYRGQSALITVASGLGGTGPNGVFLPPDLGGPGGWQAPFMAPEPSTIGIAAFGAAALLFRRRR